MQPNWQKSSRCKWDQPQCVEVSRHAEGVQVRDSKHPGVAPLWFYPHEWQAFIDGVNAGEFDLLPAAART